MTDSIAAFEARIVPELAQFVRPIGDATRHPDNIRKHRIDKIAQSLRAHGQRAAIVVQKSTGLIVKGNGTHEAAELLGWTDIAQIWQDMTDEEALAFLFADNKASDFSSYDRDKTVAGLKKLAAGPGLFDSLWEIEELEDLVEQSEGMAVLEAQGTTAALATATAGGTPITEAAKAPPERMKEIPLVMTLADHAKFVESLKGLAKLYKTNGTIATIVEAVRRQSAAEAGAAIVGSTDQDAVVYGAQRALVKEFRDYISTQGVERSYSGTWLMAQLETMVPYRPQPTVEPIAEGQVEAFPEGAEEAPVISPLRSPEDLPVAVAEADTDEDVEALEMLARIRSGSAS
jgi:hypothetical protein